MLLCHDVASPPGEVFVDSPVLHAAIPSRPKPIVKVEFTSRLRLWINHYKYQKEWKRLQRRMRYTKTELQKAKRCSVNKHEKLQQNILWYVDVMCPHSFHRICENQTLQDRSDCLRWRSWKVMPILYLLCCRYKNWTLLAWWNWIGSFWHTAGAGNQTPESSNRSHNTRPKWIKLCL